MKLKGINWKKIVIAVTAIVVIATVCVQAYVMATGGVEDFTDDWNEYDPNSKMLITANSITVTDSNCACQHYVYKDYGDDYIDYSVNMTILFDAQLTSSTSGYGGQTVIAFSDNTTSFVGDGYTQFYTVGSAYNIAVYFSNYSGDRVYLSNRANGGSDYDYAAITSATRYYYTLKLDISYGTYGKWILEIYTDSLRQSLHDTLAVVVPADPETYRYAFCCVQYEKDGSPVYPYSWDVRNVLIASASPYYQDPDTGEWVMAEIDEDTGLYTYKDGDGKIFIWDDDEGWIYVADYDNTGHPELELKETIQETVETGLSIYGLNNTVGRAVFILAVAAISGYLFRKRKFLGIACPVIAVVVGLASGWLPMWFTILAAILVFFFKDKATAIVGRVRGDG